MIFFAAFASWAEALELGGSVVADAWMETIADLDNSKLLLEVDQARAAGSAGSRGTTPFVRCLRPTKLFRKAQGPG